MATVVVDVQYENGASERRHLVLPVLIGRGEHCSLRLRSWRVGREHARLSQHGRTLLLEDLGSWHGTWVNQARVVRHGALAADDVVVIGACRLLVRHEGGEGLLEAQTADMAVMPSAASGLYAAGLASAAESLTAQAPSGVRLDDEAVALTMYGAEPARSYVAARAAAATGLPAEDIQSAAAETRPDAGAESCLGLGQQSTAAADAAEVVVDYVLVRRLHKVLLAALDLRRRNVEDMDETALRSQAEEALLAWLAQQDGSVAGSSSGLASLAGDLPPAGWQRDQLVQVVLDEALGYGPLQPLLADDSVTEIMVNGHEEIYVERAGRLARQALAFSSEPALLAVLERMVAPLGRRLDESMPLVDARLPDGSRVHAVIRPVSVRGPALTLRRFPLRRPGLDELVNLGALDADMAAFLAQCVLLRRNLLVSGGTGSGKTTLLNALSHCIGSHERVVTIEDAAELKLQHEHKVILEARPANQEGQGAISIRELVRNALRMRPDRIIVGECRGAEALDMLAAMNTGHEGSLTTLHANSPRDALSRLETMVLMAGLDLPLSVVREQIAASVDLLVQVQRLPDGRRVVAEVTEVCGIESMCIQTMTLFSYDRRHQCHRRGEQPPAFFEEWRARGLTFDPAPFLSAPHGAPVRSWPDHDSEPGGLPS